MKHILLYGDSIFLSGLAAQLRARDDVILIQQAPHEGPLKLGNLDAVIVDAKVVKAFNDTHIAQMLGYLNITGLQVGLLINFAHAKVEWKRLVRERPA